MSHNLSKTSIVFLVVLEWITFIALPVASISAEPSASSPEAVATPRPTLSPTPTSTPRCMPTDCTGAPVSLSYDVTGDCRVDQLDVLAINEYLNRPGSSTQNLRFDSNGDGLVTPLDSLVIINLMNSNGCASTPTPIPTSTPTPTPTPITTQCIWVAGVAQWSQTGSGYAIRGLRDTMRAEDIVDNISRRFTYDESRAVPACFARRWADLCALKYNSGSVQQGASFQTYGLCRMNFGAVDLATFLGVPNASSFGVNPRIPNTSWYMDENCQVIQAGPNTRLCGFAGISWSPISLILGDESSLNKDMTVVPFSLDPSETKNYTLWKGSDKSPLLVFDPQNTGKVTSAEQLFGNYAFGGRLGSNYHPANTAKRIPWNNGYEALAVLDVNNDGTVDGTELDSLSLWLDKDRDAEVDQVELVTVKSFGIQALYFRNPTKVADSKDLRLEVGFDRLVDGKLVSGSSVDWFSESFASKEDALHSLGVIVGAPILDEVEKSSDENWKLNPLKFAPHEAKNHAEDLSGFWMWHLPDEYGVKHPSMFSFEQTGENTFHGFSIVETPLEKNGGGLHTSVVVLPLEGQFSKKPNGETEIAFQIIDIRGGVTATTTATLTENGVVLQGKTTQTFSRHVEEGIEKSATINYDWVAQKFVKR
jgi:hypothetical protein